MLDDPLTCDHGPLGTGMHAATDFAQPLIASWYNSYALRLWIHLGRLFSMRRGDWTGRVYRRV